MSRSKENFNEEQRQRFSSIKKVVCANCFTDEAIKNYIKTNSTHKKCDYCGKKSKNNIAINIDRLMPIIIKGIDLEWNDPDSEGIAYESREGGYQAELFNNEEVIGNYDISDNATVIGDIIRSLHDQNWVERNFYRGSDDQVLIWAWEDFCREVTTKRRFTFLIKENDNYSYSEVSPSEFLSVLANYKNARLRPINLIKSINTNTSIYRVRAGKDKYKTAKALGAPPNEFALQANRMSPSGIPMFYGAFDKATAIKETIDPKSNIDNQIISVGHFKPTRELKLLDLSNIPKPPSVFNIEKQRLISPLKFFSSFAEDIAKPIARNGKEHIEYVPTQIITEFFRHVYKTSNGDRLDGIIYSSSKNKGKKACVIFCENHQSCKKGENKIGCLLELIKVEHPKTKF